MAKRSTRSPHNSTPRNAANRARAELVNRGPVAKDVVAVRTPEQIEGALAASGMTQSARMGPGRPLNPAEGYSNPPRVMDYPVGVNISTRSRASWNKPSFDTLKAVIDAYDVARMCINHKIDELRSMEPMFLPADGVKYDVDDAIDAARTALAFPDRDLPYDSWLSKHLENALRYDAAPLYKRRDRAGRIIGLEVVDGPTIAPYIDDHGRKPKAPNPAYFQVIHGQVYEWFTAEDIDYHMFRPQTDSPYGLAPIESILLTANTDLRFQWHFLQMFTDGSVPAGFVELPPDISSPDQVAEWQDYWDAFVQGDQAKLHQLIAVPTGTKIQNARPAAFDSAFPEYLIMRTAGAYGVVPQDLGLIKDVNRANGETQVDVQFRVNTLPWVRFIQGMLTRYVQLDLGLPVKVELDTGRDKEDRLQEAQAHKIYVDIGAESPDEVRSSVLGLPIDKERPTPRFYNNTRQGPIPLLAIEGVAGLTDPETFGPRADQPVLDQPFVPPVGVVPMPGTTDATASLAATDQAQLQERHTVETAIAAPQPAPADVVKEATAGVTSATGITGNPLAAVVETKPAEEFDDEQDQVEDVTKSAELAAYRRFVKARRNAGRWRPFQFTAVDDVTAHRLNDAGRAEVRKAAGELVAAGLCVRAADTGRVLMLQRAFDPTDPASGMWEFPGGHIEDAEEPLAAAWREWQEETGCLIPAGTTVGATWASSNGIYKGFIASVAAEADIPTGARGQVTNPDDPDGDAIEAIAWWAPHLLPGNPAVRAELAADLVDVLAALEGYAEQPTDPAPDLDQITEDTLDLVDDVAKASDADPKAPGWRDGAALVPQHRYDLAITDHYAPRIAEALADLIPAAAIRGAVQAADSAVAKAADPVADQMQQAAVGALSGADLSTADIEAELRGIYADAILTGDHSALEQLAGINITGVPGAASASVDWSTWTPGDAAAALLADDAAMRAALDGLGITIKGLADTTIDQIGRHIADGLRSGQSVDTVAKSIRGLVAGNTSRAEMIAHTETARAMTSRTLATYAANGVGQWQWIVTAGACEFCESMAAGGPYSTLDQSSQPPGHPRCRCAASPVADSVVGTSSGSGSGLTLGDDAAAADLGDSTGALLDDDLADEGVLETSDETDVEEEEPVSPPTSS